MENKKLLQFICNGKTEAVAVNGSERLIDVLRKKLGLTGTKEGCGVGECGACTVIVDGKAVNSCLVPAVSIEGRQVVTVEGLKTDEGLHPLQEAFIRHHAVQCGFCSPGLLMSAKALLDEVSNPGRNEIKNAIAGNLCRCTGYEQVIEAVLDAANRKE
ncbi:MAG: (2Fe-2S)-binding protein [Lacrimispora celerecrescens]|nr:(2Fe-2S)-binding protein [Lacrimispora celerecrescens]